MLIQFAVENFLSFHEKTVLSMRPAPTVQRDDTSTDVANNVLRCATIYGANASGKSNLVRAIRFAKDFVIQGVGEKAKIDVHPFRLNRSATNLPSSLEFYVKAASGRTYGYGFAVTRDRVIREWLSEIHEDREEQLFERNGKDFEFTDNLFAEPEGAISRQLVSAIQPGIRDNQLLLRTARELKLERFPKPIQEVAAWFAEALTIVSPDTTNSVLTLLVDRLPAFREFLDRTLSSADTGISSIRAERREIRQDEQLVGDPLELGDNRLFLGTDRKRATYLVTPEGSRYRIDLRFAHHGTSDVHADFGLEEESDGTVRLLDLAHILFPTGSDDEYVYIVDELDRSMHTLLSRWFIEQFLQRESAPTRQLVFTTHDTNLLDLRSLRPDSIWFAEKSREGASSLHSLAEYKQDQLDALYGHLEEGYLVGRFGAIPFLGDPTRLGWPPAKDPK